MHPITLRMLGAGSLIRLERLSSRCNTNPAQRGHKKKTNEKSILTQYWLNIDFYLKKPYKTNEFWKVNIDLVNIDFGSSQYWLFEFSISFIMFFGLKVNIESRKEGRRDGRNGGKTEGRRDGRTERRKDGKRRQPKGETKWTPKSPLCEFWGYECFWQVFSVG